MNEPVAAPAAEPPAALRPAPRRAAGAEPLAAPSLETLASAVAQVAPADLVALVAQMPEEQLRDAARGPLRELVLDVLLERLPEFVDAARWPGDDVTLALRLTDTRGAERLIVRLGHGRCEAGRDLFAKPDVTLELDPVDLVRMIAGVANPAILFLTGALRLTGDRRLAVDVAGCFRLPIEPGSAGVIRPTAVDAVEVARVVATVPDDELRERLRGGIRGVLLEEVFARFPEYLAAERVADADVVFGWRITSRSGAPAERWLVALRAGHCETGRELDAEPRVTLELDDADFLRLVTGNADPAALFLTGGLRLEGEEAFALELASYFRMPSAESEDAGDVDPTAVDAEEIARVVGTVSDADLRERMSGGLREAILDEIFRRFPDYLRLDRAGDLDAAIRWKITGRADGGADRYTTIISDGMCRAGRDLEADPRVTIRVDGAEFLKLVTGNANPVMSFVRGRIRIGGDIGFAAQLTALFRIPSGG